MRAIYQIGFSAMMTSNPDRETCEAHGCDVVLMGNCYLLQIEDSEGRSRTWSMCSRDCYIEFDKYLEAYLSSQENHIATIDHGIPEEWGVGE